MANNKKTKEEWIWVDGFKGTDSNMQCRGYQYELGKIHDIGAKVKVETCHSGFHICTSLSDVYKYYKIGDNNRFFAVRAVVRKVDLAMINNRESKNDTDPFALLASMRSGADSKIAAKSIEFVRELSINEIFACTHYCRWSKKDKELAIERGTSFVESRITQRKRDREARELTKLGYSRPFSEWLVKNKKDEIAKIVGSQQDLSMDMKVLIILQDNED